MPKGKRTTPPPPADETKAQKFARLAPKRMVALIKACRVVGQLSASGYEYTPEQVAQMKKSASNAFNEAFDKFDKTKARDGTTFSFADE